MNLEWRPNHMQYVPSYVGLEKYHAYVEKENLIDWRTIIDNCEMRERIARVLNYSAIDKKESEGQR